MASRYSIEEIKEKLRLKNPNIEILDTEFVGVTHKLSLKCLKDGYEWQTNWNKLDNGTGCPMCAGRPKITIEVVKKELETLNPNIEMLSTEYKNNTSHLQCRCKVCDHEWSGIWKHLKRGVGCPSCAGNIKFTLEQVKEKVAIKNSNIEVIDNKYLNSGSPLLCKCKLDGNEWTSSWDLIKNGSGCPKCARREHPGLYCITNAERRKEEFEKQNVLVYFLEIYNNEEKFYKVGITKRSIGERFSGNSLPYNFNTLELIEINLYEAIRIEKEILEKNSAIKYMPKKKFPGYGECFSACPIR